MPIKILILAANPKATVRLRLDSEVREIEEGLRRSKFRDQFVLHSTWATRPGDLRRAVLDYMPDIVHFTGHGEEAAVLFEDEVGRSKFVSNDALAGLFKLFSNTIKCVLLNACYSKSQARAIAQYIPYVIGIKSGTDNRAATEFAIGFYQALGAGKSADIAYEFACNAVQMIGLSEDFVSVLINKGVASSHEIFAKEGETAEDIIQKEYSSRRPSKPFKFIESPYRSGNLIQEVEQGNTEMFFGRKETIKQLKDILIRHDDSLVIIYGQRRTGKSCLMKYLEKTKAFEPDLSIVFTDIQGLLSEQRFYESVLNQIKPLIHFDQEIYTHVNSFDEFASTLNILLCKTNKKILIMMDEFECVTDKRFKYNSVSDFHEFLQRIRNLLQHTPNVKFVLSGTDGLKTMINDYHNPLFKAGRTLHIAFLDSTDASDLITKPLEDTVIYTKVAVKLIQEATYSHPYYIQCLCQQIVDILNKNERYLVTVADVKEAIDELQQAEAGMFEYVWDITEEPDHLVLAIIAEELKKRKLISIYRIEDLFNENNLDAQKNIIESSIKRLIQKDILLESEGGLEYTIPIGLLRTWIQRNKPLKRVRRALSI
jgi:hypothetical protein